MGRVFLRSRLLQVGVAALVAVSTGVVAYRIGRAGGYEVGVTEGTAFGSALETGAAAVVIHRDLTQGRSSEAIRGVDALIDSGIASHLIREKATPSPTGKPSVAEKELYSWLLEYRRAHPSSANATPNLTRMVAEALRRPTSH